MTVRGEPLARGALTHDGRGRNCGVLWPRRWQEWKLTTTGCLAQMGVKHAEVVTTPLVQDERGWLRLAG